MLDNLTPEQIDNLIAAGTGLIGAVVGAGATLLSTWLTKKLQTSGKVSLLRRLYISLLVTIGHGDIIHVKRNRDYI